MRLIAHRGFASNGPENTLQAIDAAVGLADEVEIDVRRCASGELVVFHDETIGRVTDGSGRLSEHDYETLRDLDVLGTGDGVPTLSAVLEAVPRDVGVTLDLKEEGTAADALSIASTHRPPTVASSFAPETLAACRDAEPTIPRAFIVDEDVADPVATAIDLECDYLHVSIDACTDRVVGEAHRAGMSVNVWTVDRRSEAERLAELGVDGVIADRWGVIPTASA